MSVSKHDWFLPRYSEAMIPLLLCFVLGNVLAAYLPRVPLLGVLGCVSWLAVFLGVAIVATRRWMVLVCTSMMALFIGILWFQVVAFHPQKNLQDVSQFAPAYQAVIEGELLPYAVGAKKAHLQVAVVNNSPATGKILLRTGRFALPEAGSWIRVRGKVSLPQQNPVPGAFNEAQYLKSHHISAVMSRLTDLEMTQAQPSTWQGHLNRWLSDTRNQVAGMFHQALSSPASEVLGGLVLGDHAVPVDRDLKKQFINTGLAHLLAASGMNVGIVAGFIFVLARCCRLPFRLQLMLALVAIAIYAMITGLPPSIQRAVCMLGLALALKWYRKELSAVYLLCLSAAMIVLVDPIIVTSIGFQLSVVTTFGLVTMVTPLARWLGYYIGRFWSDLLLIPLVAQLWVFPLEIYYFNQFPLHSILLNILVIPLVSILTCLGFTAGLLNWVWPTLGVWLSMLATPFVTALLWLVKTGDHLMPWAKWGMKSFTPVELLLLYGGLVMVAYLLSEPGQRWWQSAILKNNLLTAWSLPQKLGVALVMGCLMLVPAVFANWQQRHHDVQINVLPVSRQQAAFVLMPRHQHPIVVMPDNLNAWQVKTILDYLRHQDIHRLSVLALWPSRIGVDASTRAGAQVISEQVKVDHLMSDRPQRLRLPNLALALPGDNTLFHLQLETTCVSGVLNHPRQTKPQANCLLQYQEPGAYSVLAPPTYTLSPKTLQPGRFYHLVLDAKQGVIY